MSGKIYKRLSFMAVSWLDESTLLGLSRPLTIRLDFLYLHVMRVLVLQAEQGTAPPLPIARAT
jgi:hypothetical protein